jgi:hypothetical protein
MADNADEELFISSVRMSNKDSGLYANGNAFIVTAKKEYGKDKILTSLPPYLTKVCKDCRLYYARKPGEEAGNDEGYCQDCGRECVVTGEIGRRSMMLRISEPVKILHSGKTVEVKEGYILHQFEDQVEYCAICRVYHGLEGRAKHERQQ